MSQIHENGEIVTRIEEGDGGISSCIEGLANHQQEAVTN
jgi:hypothetical protein